MNITRPLSNSAEALHHSSSASVSSFLLALKECGTSRNLERGRLLHSQAFENGLISNSYVANTLINMYGKCGSTLDARRVFSGMRRHTIVSWNCLIQGLVENGLGESALEHFHRLEEDESQAGCSPDAVTYLHAISACAALVEESSERWFQEGMRIYTAAVKNGCRNNFVDNALLKLYTSCGNTVQARDFFNQMPKRDVVSWNILLQGYVENGELQLAMETFDRLQEQQDVVPNPRSYLAALRACTRLAAAGENPPKWLEAGKKLHSRAEASGCFDVYVGSTMIDLYMKCGEVMSARALFDRMSSLRNVVTCNCLLQGYLENDAGDSALELFNRMRACENDCHPDPRSYVIALSAVAAGSAGDAEACRVDKDDRLQHADHHLLQVWET